MQNHTTPCTFSTADFCFMGSMSAYEKYEMLPAALSDQPAMAAMAQESKEEFEELL